MADEFLTPYKAEDRSIEIADGGKAVEGMPSESKPFVSPVGDAEQFREKANIRPPFSTLARSLDKDEEVKRVAEAKASGKWMLAVWHVGEDGKLNIYRKTSGFPSGDFNEAVHMLNDNLVQELEKMQTEKK